MIRNILTLILNDLAIAFKNKTILLVFFIPLFIFTTLKLVDANPDQHRIINIGLVKNESYSPKVLSAMNATKNTFNIVYVDSTESGRTQVKEKTLDALLLKSERLVVFKKDSLLTLTILESFQVLQKTIEGRMNWITEVEPILEIDAQKQSLPTWILMLVLLVGFIIMPSQVAEEKEKRLFLALLQTPMRESEWLVAKVFYSMILIASSIVLLHFLGKLDLDITPGYIAFIFAGSFCFSAYGILLGFLCRNQATARTLGVIFYLPHLLPSALADFSKKLTNVAPFVPSYQFYDSVKLLLFEQVAFTKVAWEWFYLLAIGFIALYLSYLLIKKRWLM